MTSLSQLLAEELDCDWKQVRTEFAGVDPAYGPLQGTFGSMSIRTSWDPLRKAGASARDMLLEAAAQKWGVAKSQLRTENGYVINTANNARASYGSLADAAGKLPVPAKVTVKDPKEFHLIGTSPKRLDTPAKVNGTAGFGIDARRPGMLYAVVARCPVFGGKVASFDDSKTKAVPGVKQVVQISRGVAVVADNTWSAMEGRQALQVQFDEGKNANLSSASIRELFVNLAEKPGAVARNDGDANAALANGAKKLEAVYEVPYLSHAPMEPMNCTADVRADSAEVWVSTQIQTAAMGTTAKITGLAPDKIQIHTMYLGGGFGRRGGDDFVGEAVEISKAIGKPVKLTWSREDDMQHDLYRPASYAKFSAALDKDGWPVAWNTRVVCPSFGGLRNGVDRTSVEGIIDLEYAIPNFHVDYHPPDVDIPTTYWRSVGFSQNTFLLRELPGRTGRTPPAKIRSSFAGACSRNLRDCSACSNWRLRKPAGASRFRLVMGAACRGQQHRQLQRSGGRGVGGERQAARASRGLRGRLRARGQSRRHRAADPERHRVRTERHDEGRHHHRKAAAWCRATSTITTCCASTKCRWWKCTSYPARPRPVVSVRPARRRLFRPSPTRSLPLPASGSASFRFVPRIWHRKSSPAAGLDLRSDGLAATNRRTVGRRGLYLR